MSYFRTLIPISAVWIASMAVSFPSDALILASAIMLTLAFCTEEVVIAIRKMKRDGGKS